MSEFKVGEWYPTRGGVGKRYVVGKTADGAQLIVHREGPLANPCTRYLNGRLFAGIDDPFDLVQPPRTFEATVEVVAIDYGGGSLPVLRAEANEPAKTCGKIIARQKMAVILTEGEGL